MLLEAQSRQAAWQVVSLLPVMYRLLYLDHPLDEMPANTMLKARSAFAMHSIVCAELARLRVPQSHALHAALVVKLEIRMATVSLMCAM
jgi:hypothetical protein